MPVLNITVGAVNITNYLIVRVAKSITPNVQEIPDTVFAPAQLVNSFNVSLTVPDASVYTISWYESSDGTTTGQLLGQSTWDAKLKIQLSETLFYLTNGSRDVDPAEGTKIIADPYLNGKNITKVQKDIKLLVPPTYDFKQYDLYTGGGIQLLGTDVFNDGEITAVEVVYQTSLELNTSNAGMYDGVVLITSTQTLTASHRNKRLKCEGTGATLELTLETLAAVPVGKFIYFMSNGGAQKKTRVLCAGSDKIRYRGADLTELSIGIGEHVRLEKYSTYWEAVDAHAGIGMVGEIIAKGLLDSVNYAAADGGYVSGNIEPRLYAYAVALPLTHRITTSADLSGTYTHPIGSEGKFVINTTLRQLRMPNMQGWYLRAIDNFSTYTGGSNRAPGVSAQGVVGPHTHPMSAAKRQDSAGGNQSNTLYFGTDNGAVAFGTPIETDVNAGAENEVHNIGVIYLIRT